jgi:hypothetical protein
VLRVEVIDGVEVEATAEWNGSKAAKELLGMCCAYCDNGRANYPVSIRLEDISKVCDVFGEENMRISRKSATSLDHETRVVNKTLIAQCFQHLLKGGSQLAIRFALACLLTKTRSLLQQQQGSALWKSTKVCLW